MLAARKSRGRRWKASQYRLRVSCLVEQPALGRLALRQREQMVLVEPREGRMLIKVRAAEFGSSDAKVDASIGRDCRDDHQTPQRLYDTATFKDRYQEVL